MSFITFLGSLTLALAVFSPVGYFVISKDVGFLMLIPQVLFSVFYAKYLCWFVESKQEVKG